MFFSALKKLTLSLAILSLMATSAFAGSVTESKTGKSFADSQEVWSKPWSLIGVAGRIKSVAGLVNAKVYAIGFYMEKEAGATALSGWKGADGKIDISKAHSDSKLYNAIINCDCGRGVDIVFVRDIDGPKIRDTFVEAVTAELKDQFNTSAEDASVKDDMTKLATFLNYNVSTGSNLKFYVSKKGSLSATGAGGQLTVKNAKIAKALLATWFGKSSRFGGDSNLQELKKGAINNINNIFNP